MFKFKKILIFVVVLLYLNTSLVFAVSQQEIDEAKKLTDAKTSCNSLSDNQLEVIGEYLMEQMHPGDAHEFMHKMMGLQDGSKEEEQFHINLAKSLYCGDNSDTGSFSGMMRMSGMMGLNNMMGGGMMGSSMLGGYDYNSRYPNFVDILYIILLIGVIALIYLWVLKLWRGNKKSLRKTE